MDSYIQRWLLRSDSPSLLRHVSIGWDHTLMSLPKMLMNSTCLQRLELWNIPSLTTFPIDGLSPSLQVLENLSFLPLDTWSNYTSRVFELTTFPIAL